MTATAIAAATPQEYFIFNRRDLPPHVYATSALAYNGIQDRGRNQVRARRTDLTLSVASLALTPNDALPG